jgi:peptide/nickel transport system substrate-binding protein
MMVKNSLQRMLDKGTYNLGRYGPGPWSVAADDSAGTVTFSVGTPFSDLIYGFAPLFPGVMSGIVCPAGLANPASLNTRSAGTGLYTLVEAVSGDHMTWKLRQDFTWGPQGITSKTPGLPETVLIKVVSNDTTAANLLVTGGLDVTNIVGPDIPRLVADKSLLHSVGANHTPNTLFINQAAGRPGADIAVRQALITAIDPKAYLAGAGGQGKLSPSVIPVGDTCYDPSIATLVPKPSVEAARKVLTDAGWTYAGGKLTRNGKPLTVNLIAQGTQGAGPEYIVSQWNQVGITSALTVNDPPTWLNRRGANDFDATVFKNVGALPNPGWTMVAKVTGPPYPRGGNYLGGVEDPVLVREANAAEASTGAESCKHWAAFQQQFWKQWDGLPLFTDQFDYFSRGWDLSPSRMWLGGQVAPMWLRKLA